MYHAGIKVLYFFIASNFMPLFVFEPPNDNLEKLIYICFERDPRK